MLNYIWFSMILISIVTGFYNNTLVQVVNAVPISAQHSFNVVLSLAGIMTLWLGMMEIARDAGIVSALGRLSMPLLKRLFPSVPKDHPALGAISLYIAANMLGLSNASTPFGLKAMEELQSLNRNKQSASNDMCMLMAISTSSIQLIPTTAIGLLSIAGSQEPTVIIVSSILATSVSTVTAIFFTKFLARYYP